MMKRGQPYLGAFLLKDENTDSDVITHVNLVHPVGVFAAAGRNGNGGPGAEIEEGLTAGLYPHRGIKITELIKAGGARLEEVEQQEEPQTVEPSTPPPTPPLQAEKLTSGIYLALYSSKNKFPWISRSSPNGVFTQSRYIHCQHNAALRQRRPVHLRLHVGDRSVFKDITQLNPLFLDQITNFSINQVTANVFDEPGKLADFAAAVSTGKVQELQDVLESLVVVDHLRKALLVLKKELTNVQLQSKLSRDVDSKVAKRQREYYLMEQLKGLTSWGWRAMGRISLLRSLGRGLRR